VRKLIVGEKRVGGSEVLDPRPDRRLSCLDCLVQRTKEEANLRRELVLVHRREAYLMDFAARRSQVLNLDLNSNLRPCRDKG
jgi:hypothetical protein